MIKIFIGCAANHEDLESQAVLEYTLRKHLKANIANISITWMKLSKNPTSFFYSDGPHGWQTKAWATPFSGFRWSVPAQCDFDGLAVYMDSDCIVRADIGELVGQKFKPGKVVMAKGGTESWRYCVSLMDCAALRSNLPSVKVLQSDPMSHSKLMNKFRNNQQLVQSFNGNWNCIDGEDYKDLNDPAIKVIHYSSEAHQPHLTHAIPRLGRAGGRHWFDGQVKRHWRADLIEMFDHELAAALKAGYTLDRYMADPVFGQYNKASQKNYRSNEWGQRAGA